MNEQENEITISLGNMFAYMLRRWKLIIVFALVFMVGIGGFMSYRQYKSIESNYEGTVYNGSPDELSADQVKNVDTIYARHKAYQDRIEEVQFYLDNSLLMKLDTNNVSQYTKEYLLKSETRGVINSFLSMALELDDYKKMADVLGSGVDARYVYELVTISGAVDQDAYRIDTDKVGDVINGSIGNSYSGIMTLKVIGNSEDECVKIAQIANDGINRHLAELKKSGVEAELSGLDSSYTEKYHTEIAESQRNNEERKRTLIDEYDKFITDAKANLTPKELGYLNQLIEKDHSNAAKEQVSWVKYVVIGFVAGLFFAVVLLAILYICKQGLRTFDDIRRITKEKEVGIIVQKSRAKFFLDKFFYWWAGKIEFSGVDVITEEAATAITCDRIRNICEGKSAKKVFLISDAKSEYTNTVLTNLVGQLQKVGIDAIAGSPVTSLDSLQTLRKSDVAVLAVTMKKSFMSSVRNEYAVCEENSVPVVANFVVYPQK